MAFIFILPTASPYVNRKRSPFVHLCICLILSPVWLSNPVSTTVTVHSGLEVGRISSTA